MDPKKDLGRTPDNEGTDGGKEEPDAPEQETQHEQEEGVETTPMGQTDLEQDERGTTEPGR